MAYQSRKKRYEQALSQISQARDIVESLRDELQEWYDNLPENLQESNKAVMLDTAISSLEDVIGNCEESENTEVDFPGMFC